MSSRYLPDNSFDLKKKKNGCKSEQDSTLRITDICQKFKMCQTLGFKLFHIEPFFKFHDNPAANVAL